MEHLEPVFETLARSIVYQQLSGKVARVIFNRLAEAAGGRTVTAERIMRLTPRRMRSLGLSQQKTEYIRDLAKRTRAGKVDFEILPGLSDEEVCEHLTQVKGIGVWTAQMFLMFALRRADVLPCGDLGIRTAVGRAYGFAALPTPAEVEQTGAPWHPYCTAASWYLWRSLENQSAL